MSKFDGLKHKRLSTQEQLNQHIANTSNPHKTTAVQVLPALTGNDGKFLKANGTTVSWDAVTSGAQIVKEYQTQQNLIKDTSLTVGSFCRTLAYGAAGDGGGGEYIVMAQQAQSDDICVRLANGLTAKLQYGAEVNVRQLGIKAESNSYKAQNAAQFAYYIKNYHNEFIYFFPSGTYYFLAVNPYKGSSLVINIKGNLTAPHMQYQHTIIQTEGDDFLYENSDSESQVTFIASDIVITSLNQSGKAFGSKNASECGFVFSNVFIVNFDYGFYAPMNSTGSYGKNVTFIGCHYGGYIASSSHTLTMENLNLNYNRVGFFFKYGGISCKIKNVHIAVGYYYSDQSKFSEFVGIYTEGGLIIDGLYYEDYLGTEGNPQKQIVVDYAAGSPLYILNTTIDKVSGAGGKFMRFYRYENGTAARYMTDLLFFDNCIFTRNTSLQALIEFNSVKAQLGISIDGQNEYFGSYEIVMNRPHYIIRKDGCSSGGLIDTGTGKTVRPIKWQTDGTALADVLQDSAKLINAGNLNTVFWADSIGLYYAYNWSVRYKITGLGITNGIYQLAIAYLGKTEQPVKLKDITVSSGVIDIQGEFRHIGTDGFWDRRIAIGFLNDQLPAGDYSKINIEIELVQLGPDRAC